MKNNSPTTEFYGMLQEAFDYFNQKLFKQSLSSCIITMQREKNTMGYFSSKRWINQGGVKAHEIALNPAYFANHTLIEIFQTLCHEMCHQWQEEQGKPSRNGYHNKEWAEKMQSIGLVPSSTGKRGGKKTGQKMADFPDPHGRFLRAATYFIKEKAKDVWVDRYPAVNVPSQTRVIRHFEDCFQEGDSPESLSENLDMELIENVISLNVSDLIPGFSDEDNNTKELEIAAKVKRKIKYNCPDCNVNAWGKPELFLICGDCETRLLECRYD